MTIRDVNHYLDRLAAADEVDARQAVIGELVKTCSAKEVKWIVRIILKDLKIGLRHERVCILWRVSELVAMPMWLVVAASTGAW